MDFPPTAESSGSGCDQDFAAGVRLVVLNLPEDEGEGLGFRLTRTLWDPYPWVRDVVPDARADNAGLKAGDCLLQADGKDLLGLPVGQVAGLIRGDGAGRGVSLLVWSCGVDPRDDPELLWSCGGGSRGERARRALGGVLRALACCVCGATATSARACQRSHLYCEACWVRLERCALCREALPAKDSPYARNLVAEQVFEAIANEYDIKDAVKRPKQSVSAYTSPNRSPNMSPASSRRGQYQLSMMNKNKKTVQFTEKFGQNYASDPNIHRSVNNTETRRIPSVSSNSSNTVHISIAGNTSETGGKCSCQTSKINIPNENIPRIKIEDTDRCEKTNCVSCCQNLAQHKLVARLRQACSQPDLQNAAVQVCPCPVSRSLNNISFDHSHGNGQQSNSLDNLKTICGGAICESQPVYLLSAPPIYVLTCDHNRNE